MGVEGPIFCRQKINYLPQYDINQLRATGHSIQMIQNERQLVRIDSDNVDSEKRIDIVRSDGKGKCLNNLKNWTNSNGTYIHYL